MVISKILGKLGKLVLNGFNESPLSPRLPAVGLLKESTYLSKFLIFIYFVSILSLRVDMYYFVKGLRKAPLSPRLPAVGLLKESNESNESNESTYLSKFFIFIYFVSILSLRVDMYYFIKGLIFFITITIIILYKNNLNIFGSTSYFFFLTYKDLFVNDPIPFSHNFP